MSVLSDLAADHSASRESVDSSAVIDSETKDTAEAAATESSEDAKGVEQATSSSSETAEGAIPEASMSNQPKSSSLNTADSKTIDDRKTAASAPPTTSTPAATMENPLMWDCPYVQLKDVLTKVLTRLNKDKVGVECDVDVVRVLLDLVESNHSSLDLSSTSMKLLGSLKPVTGAVLLDAASKGEISMDVHGKIVDSDAVYVPRGRNPLYLPLVMAVFGHDDISHIKKLENMMSGSKLEHVTVRGK
eukprot:gene13787-9872_t